jgi:hypothetical protein
MALRLSDVKKTVRSRKDGGRYVHPTLLASTSIRTQVGLALAYFEARLGRARHDFDPEFIVRFFGDARLARGLVACLGETYRWRAREFADVLTPPQQATLTALGLVTPIDLRLFLYDALNAESDGFLAPDREKHLLPLAQKLRIVTPKLDQLVALDAAENAVLVRVGPSPSPEHVIALYNYHAVAAMLRHSVTVDLTRVSPIGRQALDAACGAHGVSITHVGHNAVRLHNQSDIFGSYSRGGLRLTKVLLTAAASAPDILQEGNAQVALGDKRATYLLERSTVSALTGGTGRIHQAHSLPTLADEWSYSRTRWGTAGWRLVRAPEAALCSAGLVQAPLACVRGDCQVLLWPVPTAIERTQVLELMTSGLDVLPVATGERHADSPAVTPCAAGPAVGDIVRALEEHWGHRRVEPGAQALAGLLDEVEVRGFLPDAHVAAVLSCTSAGELKVKLRVLDGSRAIHIPGLGLCSPSFAAEMRKGLRRRPRTPAA